MIHSFLAELLTPVVFCACFRVKAKKYKLGITGRPLNSLNHSLPSRPFHCSSKPDASLKWGGNPRIGGTGWGGGRDLQVANEQTDQNKNKQTSYVTCYNTPHFA